MERPILIARQNKQSTRQRVIGVVLVGALHVIFIYGLMNGLASRITERVPDEIKAVIVPPQVVQAKPVPPPPKLAQPPAPYVPQPEIDIQSPVPPTHTIYTQSTTPAPAAQSNAPADVPTAAVGSTHNCDSYYPPISQRLSQTGNVRVRYTVGTDGRIIDVVVVQSSGFVPLDQAALQCVRQRWRNTPAIVGGKPIVSTSEAIVSFKMHGA